VAELSGRVAHQAVAMAVALGHNGLDVHASWNDAWRPWVQIVVGAGAENEKRYVVALCYTDLYEFPTLSRHLEFRDAADLEARVGETGKMIRRAATEAAGLASGHRTGERKQSVETCRHAWRMRAGEPDFTLRRDDATPPLVQLLDMLQRLEQAAARDPSFGCTHAELAWVYRLAAEHDERLFPKSRAEAELAVSLDPHLGLSQFVLGYVRFFWDWKFRDAYTSLLPAVLSQPFRIQWYRYFGDAAMIVGEYVAAEREFERRRLHGAGARVFLADVLNDGQFRRDVFVALAGLFTDGPQILLTGGAVFFLFRQIVHDALAFEMPRKRLPAARPFLRSQLAAARIRAGIVVIGVIRLDWLRFPLPRLPGCGEQRQLIGRQLLAFTVAPGIQQLAQQHLDFVPLSALPIHLRDQIQHHLLQDLGIFRKMFRIEGHE
jgi:hypothetical protein